MSSEREKIEMQMRSMSFEDMQKKQEERNKNIKKSSFGKKLVSLLFWRFKVFAGILGINEKDITSSNRGGTNTVHTHNNYMQPSQRNTFKQTYQFNPEEEYRREIVSDAYFKEIGYDDLTK